MSDYSPNGNTRPYTMLCGSLPRASGNVRDAYVRFLAIRDPAERFSDGVYPPPVMFTFRLRWITRPILSESPLGLASKQTILHSEPVVLARPKMASATIVRFSLIFYAPPSAVQACKTAIFRAGAGRHSGPGNYTECCWSTMGTGQFRPGDAANPHIGRVGELEETPEVRVETLCVGEDVARKAVESLKSVHPYEEPVYVVARLEDF
ncbi:structural toxin protein RtxA [Pochonia chlamydosporia 170]|uniref:ATP phosphoribosyltransferase n=1 Tax=Pochonia chlamydosporia 170 TaxID=1380566 RepID=A0A179EY48_METCM|nr:structural toxin protein RtxA [Pochonia chlamydosporia 170]OAQ58111.1 structural toxin protein RtxA [Pochonia chlamydosporia 170]